jgi:dethiobiotin synthetase
MTRGVFVTGTDTGVGKTYASCALVHALRERGLRVAAMKPVAAGAIEADGRLVSEDTLALLGACSSPAPPAELVTPVLLREPMAPHIAAEREGREISLAPILDTFNALASSSDTVVVEGVGGFVVPLGPGLDTRDVAVALGLPVVLVVGLRLGCLNHALLSVESIEAAGLTLAGWIANEIDPTMAVPSENVTALKARITAPLLGRLAYATSQDPRTLAGQLDLTPLLR